MVTDSTVSEKGAWTLKKGPSSLPPVFRTPREERGRAGWAQQNEPGQRFGTAPEPPATTNLGSPSRTGLGRNQ
jgi:hypothetical protein